MINQEKIQEWVREYLKHIQEISIEGHVNKEEGYKFNFIDNFQKHFNLEDPDLVGMLDKALLNNNLVVGAQYWPKKMLLLYAQDDGPLKIAAQHAAQSLLSIYLYVYFLT